MENDFKEGDIVVALKGNRGNIRVATSFECNHVYGNFRKVTPKDKLLLDAEEESLTESQIEDLEQLGIDKVGLRKEIKQIKSFKEPKLYQSLLTKDGRKTGNAVVVEVSEKYTLCKIRTDYGNTVEFNFKKFDIEEQFYLGKINETHKEIAVYNSLLEHRLEFKLDTQYDTRMLLAQKEESIADSFALSYYKELLRHNVTDENERGEN